MTEDATWPPSLPARDALRPDEIEAFDAVVQRQTAYGYADFVKRFRHADVLRAFPGDRIQPYFAAMLNSPLIAAGMSDLGAVYRRTGEHPGGLSHADREWVDMVMCTELENWWVVYVHAPDAVASGVRPEAILAVIRGRNDDLTEHEALTARFIRAVGRGSMTRHLYQLVETRLGVRGAVEMACFSGHLLKTARLMQAWGVPEITAAEVEEFVEAILAGEVELPAHARVPVK